MATQPPRPQLAALSLADPAARWVALGFAVADGRVALGGVEVRLEAGGPPWTLRHIDPATTEIDGLATAVSDRPAPAAVVHPNGATALDHVVILTPDFDRTADALERAGMGLRRVRDAGGFRQGFRRLGPAIIEIVEEPQNAAGGRDGPAALWGLVVVVRDLSALAARLGDTLGEIRPAVQAGRHIARLRRTAGLGLEVAFMDPE